jgi:hypothetical protein
LSTHIANAVEYDQGYKTFHTAMRDATPTIDNGALSPRQPNARSSVLHRASQGRAGEGLGEVSPFASGLSDLFGVQPE